MSDQERSRPRKRSTTLEKRQRSKSQGRPPANSIPEICSWWAKAGRCREGMRCPYTHPTYEPTPMRTDTGIDFVLYQLDEFRREFRRETRTIKNTLENLDYRIAQLEHFKDQGKPKSRTPHHSKQRGPPEELSDRMNAFQTPKRSPVAPPKLTTTTTMDTETLTKQFQQINMT